MSKAIPLSPLSLRIYSSLGCGAAFCLIWATLRRHTGFLIASAATSAAFLTSELFLLHNAEARFYGLYIALIAWIAYNYDRLCMEAKPSPKRLAWNGLSHALALSCTYVAGFYSLAVLLSLLIRDRSVRVWRPSVYLSVVAGWSPVILFAPLIWLQRGARTWMSPPGLYAALDPVDLGSHAYILLDVFAALGVIAFLGRHCGPGRSASVPAAKPVIEDGPHVMVLGFAFLAVPYAFLLLAWVGLPLLLPRYSLPSLIGVALLFGMVACRLFGVSDDESTESAAAAAVGAWLPRRLLAAAMLAALLAFPFWRAASSARTAIAERRVARYRADEAAATVATSDPHTYFPRYYYSGESRNIYYVVRDWENQDRVMRFNQRLNPITPAAFLAAHDHFRLVSDDPAREWFEAEIRRRGDFSIDTEERTDKTKVLTVSRK